MPQNPETNGKAEACDYTKPNTSTHWKRFAGISEGGDCTAGALPAASRLVR